MLPVRNLFVILNARLRLEQLTVTVANRTTLSQTVVVNRILESTDYNRQTRHRASTSMYSLTFRVRVITPPAVWTKWNCARSRRVDFIAGEESLFAGMCSVRVRHACGGPRGWPLGSATHFHSVASNATHAPIANPLNTAQLGASLPLPQVTSGFVQ